MMLWKAKAGCYVMLCLHEGLIYQYARDGSRTCEQMSTVLVVYNKIVGGKNKRAKTGSSEA